MPGVQSSECFQLKRRKSPCSQVLAELMDTHEDIHLCDGEGPGPPAHRQPSPTHLIGVVHQGAVVAVVAHAVAVRVSLVRVVDVGTIVPLIEDICRGSRGAGTAELSKGTSVLAPLQAHSPASFNKSGLGTKSLGRLLDLWKSIHDLSH